MNKTYVLDTNVILYSSGALLSFADNNVVIPEVVLEELDSFKKDKSELGQNARHASRILDNLRKSGNLNEGVLLPNGGILRVVSNYLNTVMPAHWDMSKADNRILQVCKALQEAGETVMLITKDTFERIKADIVNIKSEDFYEKVVPAESEQYTGRIEVYVSSEKLNEFYTRKSLDIESIMCYNLGMDEYYKPELYINQFLIMYSLENKKQSALGRYDGERIVPLQYKDCRPNVTMDEEIGFLPGTEEEKIAPFMRPIFDNLEILVDSDEQERYRNEKDLQDKVRELFDRRIITTEAIAYLRGRSIIKQWVIIDEAQNLSPKQVKSIITRVGLGTKLILIGDPDQIDHPFMDSRSNGLCYASERMKGSNLCYQVTLRYEECERSPLAYEGSKRL